MAATIVGVPPDNLTCVVDALCSGLGGSQGIVDGGVGATAEEEAVVNVATKELPYDLARVVDAEWSR